MATTTENQNKQDGSKKDLFIDFIIILLGINGYQYYLSTQDKKVIHEKVVAIEEKTSENTQLIASIDSMQSVIKSQQEEYEKLGIEKKDLAELNEKLEKQKRALQADAGYKRKYVNVQKQLDEMKAMLSENGGEIEKIKKDRDDMFAANTVLKEEKVKLSDSITQIAAKTSVLEQKVKLAQKLIALNVKTTVITKKNKEIDELIYKAKSIDKLNIKFNYADNKVAEIGGRVIYIRILEPDGNTLTDASGPGTFNSEGQEITYTQKQEHLFDNSQKTIAFLITKTEGAYKPGKYLVELYTDGDKCGEGSFMVK